jgi:hypothetical protein
MKPATIRRFDFFYLAWVLLTVVDFFLQHDAYVEQVDSQANSSGMVLGDTFVTVLFIVWFVFMLLLWFLVSRKRSVVAKWIIVVLTLASVFGVPNIFHHALTAPAIVALLSLVASVMAAYSLFGSQARAWFSGPVAEESAASD